MPSVNTVRGPVDTGALGQTLMHEHIFVMSTEHVDNYGKGAWWDEEFRVADAVAKTAPITLYHAQPVSPGKFVVVFGGTVGDVAAAMPRGLDAAQKALIDSLLLAQCHPDVFAALGGLAAGLVREHG